MVERGALYTRDGSLWVPHEMDEGAAILCVTMPLGHTSLIEGGGGVLSALVTNQKANVCNHIKTRPHEESDEKDNESGHSYLRHGERA